MGTRQTGGCSFHLQLAQTHSRNVGSATHTNKCIKSNNTHPPILRPTYAQMELTSAEIAISSLVTMSLAFALALFVDRVSGFYRRSIDGEIASRRHHAIDGLRGYLALGVVLHHIHINHHFYLAGSWELTPSRFSTFLGRASVAMFFMITALLFWGRVIESKGRFDTTRFYLNRIRRLVPMYVVSAGLVIVTAISFSHFRLNVPLVDLVNQIASWIFFTLPGVPAINGFGQTSLVNTVFWSLIYEWKFYILLPFIGALTQKWNAWLVGISICICITLFSSSQMEWFFVAGCLAAVAIRQPNIQRLCQGFAPTIVGGTCLITVIVYQPLIYSYIGAILLFVPFTIIACGNSFFGLLTNRAARILGLLSYSIYLLHNWVLYLVFRFINHYVAVGALPHTVYLTVGAGIVCVTIILATMTYRLIEFPAIRSKSIQTPREHTVAI